MRWATLLEPQQTREAPITINKVLESFLFCSSELSLLATNTNLLELSLARIATQQAQITISDKAAIYHTAIIQWSISEKWKNNINKFPTWRAIAAPLTNMAL